MKLEAEMHEQAFSDQTKIEEYGRYLESIGAPKNKTPLLCREVVAVHGRSTYSTRANTSGTRNSPRKKSSNNTTSSSTLRAAHSLPVTHPKNSSLPRSTSVGRATSTARGARLCNQEASSEYAKAGGAGEADSHKLFLSRHRIGLSSL